MKIYDVLIIGGGPAGLAAALYAGRAGLSCLVLEKLFCGGQMLKTSEIDNYPGAPNIRDVFAFAEGMKTQAAAFGAEFKTETVTALSVTNDIKIVKTTKNEYQARALVLATGAVPKTLGVTGENEFSARGVSYCATCDGAFYRGKTTVVVGGGDTALEDALYLSALCEKVYLIHRRDTFRGAKHLEEKVKKTKNIALMLSATVTEIAGSDMVESVIVKDLKTDASTTIATNGVFIAVGTSPVSALCKGVVALDDNGYILTDNRLQTSIPGVFAAGDVRQKALRQVITATADGAEAIYGIQEYLTKQQATIGNDATKRQR